MRDGSFATHLRRQRNDLRERRGQLMLNLRDWPEDIRVSLPQGGLCVWVELADQVDTLSAYSQVLQQGVVITPGPLFSVSGQFKNCLRISFSHPWDGRRMEALKRLPELLI